MAETLTANVGYLLGITPSGTTVPSSTMINAWLAEAADWIVRNAPVESLYDKFSESNVTISTYTGTKPATMCRLVYVRDNTTKEPYKIRSVDEVSLQRSAINSYLTGDKAVALNGASMEATETSATLNVGFIAQPTDTGDIPTKFHDIAIKYAFLQARKEAQEGQEWSLQLQELYQELQGMK